MAYKFTDEQLKEAKILYRKGWSSYAIGEKLGGCGRTVICRLRNNGVKIRRRGGHMRVLLSNEQIQNAIALYHQGMSLQVIGNILGCSRYVIGLRLKANGIKMRRCSKSPRVLLFLRSIQGAIKLYKDGWNCHRIALKFGVSRAWVDKYLKINNVILRQKKPTRMILKSGYVQIYKPNHHLSNNGGYASEHRLVAEETLGRPLKKSEVVHHINRIRDDNRPENLQVLTKREHNLFHRNMEQFTDMRNEIKALKAENKSQQKEIVELRKRLNSKSFANEDQSMVLMGIGG